MIQTYEMERRDNGTLVRARARAGSHMAFGFGFMVAGMTLCALLLAYTAECLPTVNLFWWAVGVGMMSAGGLMFAVAASDRAYIDKLEPDSVRRIVRSEAESDPAPLETSARPGHTAIGKHRLTPREWGKLHAALRANDWKVSRDALASVRTLDDQPSFTALSRRYASIVDDFVRLGIFIVEDGDTYLTDEGEHLILQAAGIE